MVRTPPAERFIYDLDWNLLRTFVVIAESGSITGAAEKLLRGQPAISLALQRLEAQFGDKLIERRPDSFQLTAVGRVLYRECAEIFDHISHLSDVAQSVQDEITGTVTISLASHVTTPLLDETLANFHRLHPGVNYKLDIKRSTDVAQEVLDKSITCGVCLVSRQLPKLKYTLFYREYFGFYCGPTHELFGRKDLKMSDLQGLSSVSFGTDDVFGALRPVAMLRQEYGLDQNIVGRSANLEEVRRMIVAGLGIGPLPTHVVERDVSDGLLWRLPPYTKPPAIDIYLVTNPDKRYNRAETGFLCEISDAIDSTSFKQRTYISGN